MLVQDNPTRTELRSVLQISRYWQPKIYIFLLNARFVFPNILYDIRINTKESVSQSVSHTHEHSIRIQSLGIRSVSQSISHSARPAAVVG